MHDVGGVPVKCNIRTAFDLEIFFNRLAFTKTELFHVNKIDCHHHSHSLGVKSSPLSVIGFTGGLLLKPSLTADLFFDRELYTPVLFFLSLHIDIKIHAHSHQLHLFALVSDAHDDVKVRCIIIHGV